MAITNWNYKEENGYKELEVGAYRIRIAEATTTVSQSGKDMIKLVFDVSGTKSKLWHYIVFLEDRPEITNRNLTQLFDSFGINRGDFILNHWIGKVGACQVKHDEDGKARIQWFIPKNKQTELPAWQENNDVISVKEDSLPFEPFSKNDTLPF